MTHPANRLQNKLQAIIKGRSSPADATLIPLLHALSLLYGGLSRCRNTLYRQGRLKTASLPCKVISIGNITVGGTGKTPMTAFLARQIQDMGLRPAVVSRGYKGGGQKRGMVVSDGIHVACSALDAGDEPYLLASLLDGVPVVIGQNRLAAGRRAMKAFEPDIVLLDDAYQHQRLQRDLNILLLDASAPFGNGHLLPRGPLRETCSAMSRADAVLFTRCHAGHYDQRDALEALVPPVPVFLSSHRSVFRGYVPAGEPVDAMGLDPAGSRMAPGFDTGRLFAFAGLADNSGFCASARGLGATLSGAIGFGDHHRYTDQDLADIVAAAGRSHSTGLITTDKDWVRLPARSRLPVPLFVLGVEIAFGNDHNAMCRFLKRRLTRTRNSEISSLPRAPRKGKGARRR